MTIEEINKEKERNCISSLSVTRQNKTKKSIK